MLPLEEHDRYQAMAATMLTTMQQRACPERPSPSFFPRRLYYKEDQQQEHAKGLGSRRVVMGADHAGYPLKEILKAHLIKHGIDVIDEGSFSEDPVDYPAIGSNIAGVMLTEKIPGIFLGGSGLGEAMVGNKIPGIRAARCATVHDAEVTRRHNDANMLCLGGRTMDAEEAKKIVNAFLATPFEGGRHEKRLKQLHDLDGYPYP
jgi:ribose 5-phosphate isomerase B